MDFYLTNFGGVRVGYNKGKISSIEFGPRQLSDNTGSLNNDIGIWLTSYDQGQACVFDLSLCDLSGVPDFYFKVYTALHKIPYGQVKTYKEIAHQIGNPQAQRAVGQANKNNPLPLVIPCHRVVAQNSMGGFAFGLDLKKSLLKMEGVVLESDN